MSLSAALKAGLIAALVALAIGFYALGFSAGGNRELARASTQVIALEKATSASSLARLKSLRAEALAALAKNEALEQQLGKARQATRVVYRTIKKEIPHALQQAQSETVDGDACHLNVGPDFVELWDRASDPARAAAAVAAPPTGVAPRQAAEADLAARVDLDALLRNHTDNAELATEAREQLEALIDSLLDDAEAPHE